MKAFVNRILASPFLMDSFWAVVGNALTKLLAFLAAILVARILQKELYGEYGLLRNIVINIGMLSTFGLGYSATKFIADAKHSGNNNQVVKATIWITIIISSTIAIALFIFANYISYHYLNIPHLSGYLKIISIWIVLNAITVTQTGILAGFGVFKKMAKWNVIIGIITFLLTLIGIIVFNFFGAILSLVVAQLVNVLCFQYLINQQKITNQNIGHFEPFISKKLVMFSTPIALQELIYSISSILVMILILRSSNTGELGIFNAASQWSSIILFIPSILRNVMLKHFSAQNDNRVKLEQVVNKSLKLNFLLTTGPVFILILGLPLLSKLYGDSFDGLNEPVIFLLSSTIFMSVSNVFNQFFLSLNRNWLMFWMRIFRDFGILLIGFTLISMKICNASTALSLAYLISNIVYCIMLGILYKNIKTDEKYVEL